MARTDALSINIDANTADKLAEIQGYVIVAPSSKVVYSPEHLGECETNVNTDDFDRH